MMRITGGQWRSRPIRGPKKNMPVRPTPDALRERAFNIIGPSIDGARFLDLFAGTGAVGLEALSRGASSAVFVEAHRATAELLRANLASFQLESPRVRVLVRPATTTVNELARRGDRFELIWADPPFATWQEGLAAVAAAARRGVLVADGRAYLECPDQADQREIPPELELLRTLGGGASGLWILGVRRPDEPLEETS